MLLAVVIGLERTKMSSQTTNIKMSPTSRKRLDNYLVQSDFRSKHPDKFEHIRGQLIPSPYSDSVEGILTFANEKIKQKRGESAPKK
jgi:hypothetical protein